MKPNWPELIYEDWKDTYATLHRWVQIVGKIRLSKEPWCNHSWSSTLYVTSCGLGTSAISNGPLNFSIDFDFLNHQLIFQTSDARKICLPLQSESVSVFYKRVMDALDKLSIDAHFYPYPNELPDATFFGSDKEHRVYNPEHVQNLYRTLVPIDNALKEFRSRFEGKCSPVHLFWGSFDLAVTRFSGRVAPAHPGGIPHLPDRVAKEAYSHEVSSCGFWPGNEMYPHAAFYSYAYPDPPNFAKATIKPEEALYHPELREFLLPYDKVQKSEHPEKMVMDFFQTTYDAAADLGKWDRKVVDTSPFLSECQIRQKETPSPHDLP